MRIGPQIPTIDPAVRAPDRVRADELSGYELLFAASPTRSDGVGPDGLAAAVNREMTDPLGLAARSDASTAAGGAVEPEAPATRAPTNDIPARTEHAPVADRSAQAGSERLSESISADADDVGSERSMVRRASRPASPTEPVLAGKASDAAGAAGAAGVVTANVMPTRGVAASGADLGGDSGGVRAIAGASSSAGSGAHSGGQQTGGQLLQGLTAQAVTGRASVKQPGAASFAQQAQVLRGQEAEVAPQVAKGLATLVLKDGGQAHIQLRPEALGRVDVDLKVKDGVVHATLSAENETARELLRQDLDRLRALLEQRGLRVEGLEITPGDDERDALADTGDSRGGRWNSALDEPRGAGMDAGSDSPGRGGEQRARGGAPWPHAERGLAGPDASQAEPGGAHGQGVDGFSDRRRPSGLLMRLDTVA